jgi:WhiB family transcriptional regulator, redox-sensing transcriptional regulator
VTAAQSRPRTPGLPVPALAGWRYQAACRGTDLSVFFPGRGEPAGPARRICAGCPVRQPCLDYALSHAITHGIWGGLTERDRRPLRVHRTVAARRDRDQAIAAASADGQSHAAIGRAFGLTATSVTRVLSRDTDPRRRS